MTDLYIRPSQGESLMGFYLVTNAEGEIVAAFASVADAADYVQAKTGAKETP